MIKKILAVIILTTMLLVSCTQDNTISETSTPTESATSNTLTLTEDELYDKILGSWVGQMAGVVWGASTEFVYRGEIIPESEVPEISSLDINRAFGQDDIYVEIPFIDAMKEHGYDCELSVLAESFKNTEFGLDHANKIARENLQKGIEAPLSGSYLNNVHCDDIDWQIEADFVGTMYPGLVNDAAQRAFEIGHIMNYSDGVYGGVFVSAMHAAAFAAESVEEIINAGINAIPEGSQFRTLIDEVMTMHNEGKTWQECWQGIEDKWGDIDRCLWYSQNEQNIDATFNIDAKLNSAYILIGLLYGNSDFNESMKISMQCGQDSDCNPSSVGAILGNYYGFKNLPAEWKTNLAASGENFSYTEYSLKKAVDTNYKTMLTVLEAKGFEKVDESWIIELDTSIIPVALEQWPDMPSVEASISFKDGVLKTSLLAYDHSGIKSVSWDMGDGTILKENTPFHLYTEIGKYQVNCVVTNNNDNSFTYTTEVDVTELFTLEEDTRSGEVRNVAYRGVPICSVTNPSGSGNLDINAIRDGIKNGICTDQFDTYIGDTVEHDEYIGYIFADVFEISSLVFTEGMNFDNGGWFADGTLQLQVLVDGSWVNIEATISPQYPNGNIQAAFGEDFETYKFSFEGITCTGIRLNGKAGGTAGFIGVAELEVTGVEAD